jgi:hypothetical protein
MDEVPRQAGEPIYYEPSVGRKKTARQRYESSLNFSQSTVRGKEFVTGSRSVLISEHGYQSSKYRRIINRLSPEHSHFLRYIYSSQLNWDDYQNVCVRLWKEFLDFGYRFRGDTQPKAKALAEVCVIQFRRGIVFRDEKYSQAHLAKLAKISSSNWSRDWSPRWESMESILIDFLRAAFLEFSNCLIKDLWVE